MLVFLLGSYYELHSFFGLIHFRIGENILCMFTFVCFGHFPPRKLHRKSKSVCRCLRWRMIIFLHVHLCKYMNIYLGAISFLTEMNQICLHWNVLVESVCFGCGLESRNCILWASEYSIIRGFAHEGSTYILIILDDLPPVAHMPCRCAGRPGLSVFNPNNHTHK